MRTFHFALRLFAPLAWLVLALPLPAQHYPARVPPPADAAPATPVLSTEKFPVTKKIVDRLAGVVEAGTTDDPYAVTPQPFNATLTGKSAAIRQFFQNAGVDFAGVPGSMFDYDGSAIIVTQTARNLDKIRNILARYKDVKEVHFETKFEEADESELSEFSLNWPQSTSSAKTGAGIGHKIGSADPTPP